MWGVQSEYSVRSTVPSYNWSTTTVSRWYSKVYKDWKKRKLYFINDSLHSMSFLLVSTASTSKLQPVLHRGAGTGLAMMSSSISALHPLDASISANGSPWSPPVKNKETLSPHPTPPLSSSPLQPLTHGVVHLQLASNLNAQSCSCNTHTDGHILTLDSSFYFQWSPSQSP